MMIMQFLCVSKSDIVLLPSSDDSWKGGKFLFDLNIPICDLNKDTGAMTGQCEPVGQRWGERALQ